MHDLPEVGKRPHYFKVSGGMVIRIALCVLTLVGSAWGEEIAGIGVVLGKEGDGFVIRGILPDSVAARNNAIRVGDRLLTIAQ